MTDRDVDYYQKRAEQEIELAQRATKPEVVAAHYRLSELYLARLAPVLKIIKVGDQPVDPVSPATMEPTRAETPDSPEGLLDHH